MIMFSLLFWRIMSSFFSAFSFPTFSSSFIYQFFLLLYFCLQFSGKENIIFELIKEILHFFTTIRPLVFLSKQGHPLALHLRKIKKENSFFFFFPGRILVLFLKNHLFFFSFSLLGELVLLKKVSSLSM